MINFLMDSELNICKDAHWDIIRKKVYKKEKVFVDIVSPSTEDIDNLRELFNFHPVNLEDCMSFSESPKLDEYKEYIFTVIHSIIMKPGYEGSRINRNAKSYADIYESYDVHIFVGKGFVITLHSIELEVMEETLRRAIVFGKSNLDCEFLYYLVLDSIVDSYFPIIDNLSDKIDLLEDSAFDNKNNDIMKKVMKIRKSMMTLKRAIEPQRELLYKVSHTNILLIGDEAKIYLKDVYDHVYKACNIIEEQRELLSDITELHFSKVSAGLNEIMQRLTIVSTIFMPLTFIVGVYGMNFKNMPELEWKYGYFGIMALILALGIGLWFYFRRRKWL